MTKRRFAPLKPGNGETYEKSNPRLKGVIFDVDGTLCEPQNYMFGEMRAMLGIQKSVDILDHIYALPSVEQDDAMEKIRNIERKAMQLQAPQAGLVQLMDYLDRQGIRKGICTRNFNAPVDHLLQKFLPEHIFSPIITRDFRPPKPDPAGILFIASEWGKLDNWDLPSNNIIKQEPAPLELTENRETSNGLLAEVSTAVTSAALPKRTELFQKGPEIDVIMVGDSIDDMTAGYRAGAATVLLVNEANKHLAAHTHTDLVVNRLDDLIQILEEGFESQDTNTQEV